MSGYLDPAARRARTAELVRAWRARGMSAAGIARALGETPTALERRWAEAEVRRLMAGPRTRPEAAQVKPEDEMKSKPAAPSNRPTPEAVIAALGAAAGLGSHLVRAGDGTRRIAAVRHLAMALARELGGWSFPALGAAFGCNQSSVVYGCRMTRLRLDGRCHHPDRARLAGLARRVRAALAAGARGRS